MGLRGGQNLGKMFLKKVIFFDALPNHLVNIVQGWGDKADYFYAPTTPSRPLVWIIVLYSLRRPLKVFYIKKREKQELQEVSN